MIGYLKGELADSRQGKIIIDVNGVGFEVIVSDKTRENMPSIGNEIKIYTYMCVREDDISLFGFSRHDEQDMFLKLITVSGVGPKGALAILSVLDVPDLKYAILSEEASKIAKAPSIGKKTAERIIIDLKDKIDRSEIIGVTSSDEKEASSGKITGEKADAVDALVSLGYDRKSSEKAVLSVENSDSMNSSDILKQALRFLF